MKLFVALLFFLFSSHVHAQDTSTVLDGSLSQNATTFLWRQISGQQTQLINPDSVKCEVKGLRQGQFEYELLCKNDFGEDRDSVIVTVIQSTLGIHFDTLYQVHRNRIEKLEIKVIARSGDIFIQIKSPKPQKIHCTLYDVVGRPLANVDFQVKNGINYVSLPKPQVSGLYIVRFLTYYDLPITQKIII